MELTTAQPVLAVPPGGTAEKVAEKYHLVCRTAHPQIRSRETQVKKILALANSWTRIKG